MRHARTSVSSHDAHRWTTATGEAETREKRARAFPTRLPREKVYSGFLARSACWSTPLVSARPTTRVADMADDLRREPLRASNESFGIEALVGNGNDNVFVKGDPRVRRREPSRGVELHSARATNASSDAILPPPPPSGVRPGRLPERVAGDGVRDSSERGLERGESRHRGAHHGRARVPRRARVSARARDGSRADDGGSRGARRGRSPNARGASVHRPPPTSIRVRVLRECPPRSLLRRRRPPSRPGRRVPRQARRASAHRGPVVEVSRIHRLLALGVRASALRHIRLTPRRTRRRRPSQRGEHRRGRGRHLLPLLRLAPRFPNPLGWPGHLRVGRRANLHQSSTALLEPRRRRRRRPRRRTPTDGLARVPPRRLRRRTGRGREPGRDDEREKPSATRRTPRDTPQIGRRVRDARLHECGRGGVPRRARRGATHDHGQSQIRGEDERGNVRVRVGPDRRAARRRKAAESREGGARFFTVAFAKSSNRRRRPRRVATGAVAVAIARTTGDGGGADVARTRGKHVETSPPGRASGIGGGRRRRQRPREGEGEVARRADVDRRRAATRVRVEPEPVGNGGSFAGARAAADARVVGGEFRAGGLRGGGGRGRSASSVRVRGARGGDGVGVAGAVAVGVATGTGARRAPRR